MDGKGKGDEEGKITTDNAFEKFCFEGELGQELDSCSDFCYFLFDFVLFCGRPALFSDVMVLVQKEKLMYRRKTEDNY